MYEIHGVAPWVSEEFCDKMYYLGFMNAKTKNIIGWTLSVLAGGIFALSGIMKMSGAPEVVSGFAKMGLEGQHVLIGVTELVCALLFLIPRTGVLGLLLLMAYCGGIVLAHAIGGMSVVQPIILGLIFGIAAHFRFPEVTERLLGNRS